jgi:predicted enzyme related to lactoylglutathione lyase
MQRVTGIGGVFLKAKDPKALAAWYDKHLGLSFGDNLYLDFPWVNTPDPSIPGHTVFSFTKETSTYFAPSEKPFMINFRVKDLHALLAALREEGVTVMDDVMEEVYGKFGWIVDPEGNKVELWEPLGEQ